MKKALKIAGLAFGGLLILSIVIALIPGGDERLKETNESLKQTSEDLQQNIEDQIQPTNQLSEEDQIKELVKKQITGGDTVRTVDVLDQLDGSLGVFVEYEADNGGTASQRKERIERTMVRIYANVYENSVYDVTQMTVSAYLYVPEVNVNTFKNVYKTILKKEDMEKADPDYAIYLTDAPELETTIKQAWTVSIFNAEYL